MDVKAKAPDPDDLTSEEPFVPPSRKSDGAGTGEPSTPALNERKQPDRSAPHIPPPD